MHCIPKNTFPCSLNVQLQDIFPESKWEALKPQFFHRQKIVPFYRC